MDVSSVWTWIGRLKDILTIAGVLLAMGAFVWWWLTCEIGGWLVWQISIVPSEIAKIFVTFTEGALPVVIVRFMVANPTPLPQVIEDVRLILRHPSVKHAYEFEAVAIMAEIPFTKESDGWKSHFQDFFRPFLIKAYSEASYDMLFQPVREPESNLTELTQGRYEAKLNFTRSLRKPKIREFAFQFEDELIEGFREQGMIPTVLSRNFLKSRDQV